MSYIYETHSHTREASRCGIMHGKDYAEYMSARGYSGMIITDHFFNGNSRVPYFYSWKDKVEMYCSGYEAARKAAEGTGFTVMFGIEFNFEGDEYLIYGPDKAWLLDNPDIMMMDRPAVHEAVHKAGGIMIQAHPYRERDYLNTIHLTPSIADGIEIYNAANGDNMNALAYEYAGKLGVPMTAGSDIHFAYDGLMGGMSFEHRIESVQDYVRAIKNGEGTPVIMRNGTAIPVASSGSQTVPVSGPTLPVIMH